MTLTWSDQYSVNIKEIDEQNKMLLDIVNEFDEAVGESKEEETLEKTIDLSLHYVNSYFTKQEELMKKYGYPNFDDHKDQHNKIIEELFHICKKHKEGDKEVARKIAFFFGYWLNTHVLIEDRKLGEFLNNKGVT
tara:strand:+ start:1084 stop:1488 length:405 start_codon:yes stop_codon:yes gene_type:complete